MEDKDAKRKNRKIRLKIYVKLIPAVNLFGNTIGAYWMYTSKARMKHKHIKLAELYRELMD